MKHGYGATMGVRGSRSLWLARDRDRNGRGYGTRKICGGKGEPWVLEDLTVVRGTLAGHEVQLYGRGRRYVAGSKPDLVGPTHFGGSEL